MMSMLEGERVKESMQKIHDDCFKIECEVLDGGTLPAKAHRTDAGWDLYATDDIVIYPGQVVKHPLNIKLKLPTSTWAEITSKSGLGAKGILVYAGVIDEAYRGIPHVVFTNVKYKKEFNQIVGPEGEVSTYKRILVDNTDPVLIKKGEKLAQLIMNPHSSSFFMVQVDKVDENTDRGAGGFGSSGR